MRPTQTCNTAGVVYKLQAFTGRAFRQLLQTPQAGCDETEGQIFVNAIVVFVVLAVALFVAIVVVSLFVSFVCSCSSL